MTDTTILIQLETSLASIAIILLFFICLYVYRVWKSNQSIMKKLDLLYKKMLGLTNDP